MPLVLAGLQGIVHPGACYNGGWAICGGAVGVQVLS